MVQGTTKEIKVMEEFDKRLKVLEGDLATAELLFKNAYRDKPIGAFHSKEAQEVKLIKARIDELEFLRAKFNPQQLINFPSEQEMHNELTIEEEKGAIWAINRIREQLNK